MKKILLLVFFALSINLLNAQVALPYYDGFAYTVGQGLQTQTAWNALNSGDDVTIADGSLTYTNFATSIGNKIAFVGGGIEAYKKLETQSTGTVYYSYLLNVKTADAVTDVDGGYITGFMQSGGTTTYGGTCWVRKDGTGFQIGIETRTAEGAALSFTSGTPLTYNTTYLVVVAYTFTDGASNDVVKLWVNPEVGLTEAPVESVSDTHTGTDLNDINGFLLRQDSNTETADLEIDELRIGTTWSSVAPKYTVPATLTVTPESISDFTYKETQGPSVAQSFVVSGSNLSENVTISLPNNYELSYANDPFVAETKSFSLAPTENALNITLFVRLKAGLTEGNYNENIDVASGAAAKVLALSGSVTAAPKYIDFYFAGPTWMDNNPHTPEVWGPFTSVNWTKGEMTLQPNGWWKAHVEVTDNTAEITYQSRFAQGGTTKYQKAEGGTDPKFITTTGEIWIDASDNASFTWIGNDFILLSSKITNAQPNTAPVIGTITLNPEVPTSTDAVKVTAVVSDAENNLESVFLKWGLTTGDYSGGTIKMVMPEMKLAIYQTETNIPAHAVNTIVYFIIEATDAKALKTTTAEQNYVTSPATGFEGIVNEGVKIYTLQNTLVLNGENMQQFMITNLSGQIVLQNSITENEISIDTQAIEKGIYLVKVKTSDKVYTQKVFIE